MTVALTITETVIQGNGVTTVFSFPFIGVDETDIAVTITDSSGASSLLDPAFYLVTLNPTGAGQLWAIGGTVTYPLIGPALPSGSSITIARILPLKQETSIQAQGPAFRAIERQLDYLTMSEQQINDLVLRAIRAPSEAWPSTAMASRSSARSPRWSSMPP